jgi:ABC-type nitrate/sulfonate/bicarbonate transport system substrate-binding protein
LERQPVPWFGLASLLKQVELGFAKRLLLGKWVKEATGGAVLRGSFLHGIDVIVVVMIAVFRAF